MKFDDNHVAYVPNAKEMVERHTEAAARQREAFRKRFGKTMGDRMADKVKEGDKKAIGEINHVLLKENERATRRTRR